MVVEGSRIVWVGRKDSECGIATNADVVAVCCEIIDNVELGLYDQPALKPAEGID